MSENLGGGHTETHYDAEVADTLDFLEKYQEIQEDLSWLVEASASAPMLKAVKRARIRMHMQQLGIDTDNPDDPGGYKQLANIKAGIADRSLHPRPRVEIPDVTFFEHHIAEIKANYCQFGGPYHMEKPLVDGVSLIDIIGYGHTDWDDVQARTGHLPSEIQKIAVVMADPIAYHSWAYGGQGRATDHITVAEDWSIQNGRHRSLAAACLGEDFIHDSGIAQWVPVLVESD